jgi:hypothetical protein
MSNRLPKPTRVHRNPPDLARIFKPVEHALLAKYLGLPELLPEWAKGSNLEEFPVEDWDEAEAGIAPLGSVDDHNVLENAVARIALAPVQNELPQWAVYDGDQTILGRTIREFPDRDAMSRPLLLFGINWATSGPGFSWPQDYYVTWIPHYDRYIVTASSDSDDVNGFEDITIGFFQARAAKGADHEAIKEIITGFWSETSEVQMAWEDYWRSGAVDHETAWKWRNEVWSPEEDKGDAS